MTSDTENIFLFANGDLPAPEAIRALIGEDDTLIAVDGGLKYLTALGLVPDLVIGDLDSADPDKLSRLEKQGVEIRRFPAQKDETDLELALNAALKLNPASIRVIAALGGRLDQTLANIFLLSKTKFLETDIRLIDGAQEVFLIRDDAEIKGQPGQRVSLLPLLGAVEGVRSTGLQYPLNAETLYPDQTRGISNVMNAETAAIRITHGLLLCIHETTPQTNP